MPLRAELSAYKIKRARRPQTGQPLSGVVVVLADGLRGTIYISFSEKLVQDIGMLLPQGISLFSPAYLRLTKWPTGEWKLSVRYIAGGTSIPLLEYNECPVWVGKIRSKHEQGKKARKGSSPA